MPAVSRVQVEGPPGLGVSVPEDAVAYFAGSDAQPALPVFDPANDQAYFIEVFNTGRGSLDWEVAASADWIKLSATSGSARFDERIQVGIDWSRAPADDAEGAVRVSGGGGQVAVRVPLRCRLPAVAGFVENNGVVSIDAANYTRAIDADVAAWIVLGIVLV
jgi:hypothetical protein